MKRDDAVKIVNYRLGNRRMNEVILAEMKFVQREVLEQRPWLPWFLESELATASTQAGERRVPLPEDFLMEIEEESLWLEGPDGALIELDKIIYDKGMRVLTGSGMPEAYALASGYFQFFPKPDAAYPLHMRYLAKGPDITADDLEISWLLHAAELVVAEVGLVIAEKHLQNANLAMAFRADAEKANTALYNKHIALQELNQVRLVGGE